MFKALILDDEVNNTQLLEYFIPKYCPQITGFSSANTLDQALEIWRQEKFDILFLDISLGNGTSGFDFLNRIDFENVQIIFVTAFNEYAVKAFKYNAVDYLVKPVVIDELRNAVNNACKRIESGTRQAISQVMADPEIRNSLKNEPFIAIPYTNKIEIVPKKEIFYIHSEGKYSLFQTQKGKYESSKNLGEYERILQCNEEFIRVHHSYIVNMNYIRQISKKDSWFCLMEDGITIPVSRRRQEDLYKILHLKN